MRYREEYRRVSAIRDRALAVGKPAELNLLLFSARTTVDTETEAHIRRLLQHDLDWAYLIQMAYTHRVVPLLYRSLCNTAPGLVPDNIRHQLQRVFHVWGLLTHALIEQLLDLLKRFSAQEISAILFKGPALGAYAYGNPVLRKPGDLDLLIHRRDYAQARDLLIDRGYQPRIQPTKEARYVKRRQSLTFVGKTGNVDLHWTLADQPFDSFPFSSKLDTEHVWECATTLSLSGTPVLTLAPEDLLIYLCNHSAKHSWLRLYMVCDIAELLRRQQDTNWHTVLRQARNMHNERILYLGLLLASALLGTTPPEPIWQNIKNDDKVTALALQVTQWLFDPARGFEPDNWLRYHLFRINMLESLHEKTRYVFYRGLRKFNKISAK